MIPIRNAAISLAAASMIVAPVAASAAPALDGSRAVSTADGQSKLSGSSSWIIGLVGLLVGVTAMIIVASDDDDEPVSP